MKIGLSLLASPNPYRGSRPKRTARRRLTVSFSLLTATGLFAQTSERFDRDEEVLTLPDFQVSADLNRDEWVASQAMSGSRTAAPIVELPYQVQVLTQEFLDDFQLGALSEQLSFFPAYSSSSDQADMVSGSFSGGRTLRGFDQTIVRDGFRRTPPPTRGNTAQVEVIKGPVSTLYGDASPGGLINYVSKRPGLRPRSSLSVSGGEGHSFRSNVMATGPLYRDKVFYLVNAENYYRHGSLTHTWARNGDYVFGLLFKLSERTSISFNYEIVRLEGARGASVPLLMQNTTPTNTRPGLSWSGGVASGIDWTLAKMRYSRFGPNEYYHRNYDGLNVLVEHSFGANWKQRLAYQGQWKSFDQKYRTNSNVSAVTGRMNDVRPNLRLQDIDGPVAIQTDLLGHFTTGKLKHSLLFTADYAEEQTRDQQMRLSNQQVRDLLPDSYRYPDPYNQDWSTEIDYDLLQTIGSKNYENVTSKGASVSDRVFFADGKGIAMANVRYDKSKFATDASTTTHSFTHGEADSTTYSTGLNWKLAGNGLVLFANHSTSFNTNVTVDRNLGTTIPNEKGRGWEAGVKSLAYGGRLGVTLSAYEIEKFNIGQRDPDFVLGGPMPEYLGSGRERARGVDGDVNVKVSDRFTILAGAAYIDARVVQSTNETLINTRKVLIPRHTAMVALRYKPDGRWKGWSFGTAFRYTGGFVRANATATRQYEEGAPRQLYNAFVAYSWQRTKRVRHTVQVNGSNLSDKFYVGPDNTVGMGRQVTATYTLRFR